MQARISSPLVLTISDSVRKDGTKNSVGKLHQGLTSATTGVWPPMGLATSELVDVTMLRLTLPDGNVKEFSAPVTGLDVAQSIGKGLAAAALAVKLDGELRDLMRPIEQDAKIEIVTRKSADALELIRHDTAHVLAEAVQELFPGTQVTIGPSIENGFYCTGAAFQHR